MKKLFIAVMLIFLTLPVFSQEKDSRAPFQGIWYPIFYEYKNEVFTSEECFIFIDDIFITTLDGYFISGHYSVEKNNLILTNPRILGDDGWEDAGVEDETGTIIQYIFSGDRLILLFDGDPTTFSRNYTG
jgi:hypothetical protein